MLRILYLIIGLAFISSCQPRNGGVDTTTEEQEDQSEFAFNDSIPVPAGLTQLVSTEGDLDKDGIAEKIIIYNTARSTEMGTEREIHIFQKGKTNWELWHQTTGGLLPSEHGGIFGDPFSNARIERGCIVIEHFGGSRQKWSYLHRYRFQNQDWELIGTTVGFGTPCESWETFDYNLSTGQINYKMEKEDCEGEQESSVITKQDNFSITQDDLPSMDDMYPGNNGVEVPNTDLVFYY